MLKGAHVVKNSPQWYCMGMVACSVTAGAAMLSVVACTHVAPAPFGYVVGHSAERVWVVRKDNDSTVEVIQPREENDTLMGFAKDGAGQYSRYVEFGRRDIKQLRAKQAVPIRTAALVAGIAGVAVFGYTQLVGGGGKGVFIPCPYCDFDDVCC